MCFLGNAFMASRTRGVRGDFYGADNYEAVGILKELFEKRRNDFTGRRFITNENEDYPF